MKVKYFSSNEKYFDFFRKNKGRINIKNFKILENKIYIKYEILKGVKI